MKKINLLFAAFLLSVCSLSAIDYTISLKTDGCEEATEFVYPQGATVTITAANVDGYVFRQWDDGNTDNPRQIKVTEDVTCTAQYFAPCFIAVQSNDESLGTVDISLKGVYWFLILCGDKYEWGTQYNKQVTYELTAMPADDCDFIQWDDGNTDNPRRITTTITENITHIAQFRKKVTIGMKAQGCDLYQRKHQPFYEDEILLYAVPKKNYDFVRWNDGNTDNPRSEVAVADKTFTAIFAPKEYIDIKAFPREPKSGVVTGSGTYANNSEVTLIATPNQNYRFLQWNDGCTDSLRIIRANADKSEYIAVFDAMEFTIEVNCNDSLLGTVIGSGSYKYNTEAFIEAKSNNNATFAGWNDGDKSNSRVVYVDGDKTYTAKFGYRITAQTNGAGTVKGGGIYSRGSVAVLTAIPPSGYIFVQWNDRSTENPHTITVTGNRTYEAQFAKASTITVQSANTTMGTVSGGGTYIINSAVTLTATPEPGCVFVQWNDGNTENPRTILASQNEIYTATFATAYTITAHSANSAMGTVSGGGTYANGSTATLTVVPESGYAFKQWNDGNTQNPRMVTVTGNKTYTAIFAATYTIAAQSANTTMGTVSGGGTYANGSTATLTATPKTGYAFVQWDDGNTQNPRTVSVTDNKTYTATFAAQIYTITATSNNSAMGSVSGGGQYSYNTSATLTALPQTGYEFVQWSDGVIQNPRTVAVAGNVIYTAMFRAKPTVKVKVDNSEKGIVSGGGQYATNSSAVLRARANYGYYFVQWSDGNTQNPRTVNVYGDVTYTALFKGIDCYITVSANFNAMGIVDGGGKYEYGTVAGLAAIPINECHFVKWSDGSTENPRYVKVAGDRNYMAEFGIGGKPEEAQGETVNKGGVSITPYETKAEFYWPSITGVASYSLVIWADEAQGKKVCTLTFNANGQLTNIDFTQSVKPQGSASAGGLNFTVTGLKPSTTYGYTLDAKDAEDEVIETKHGTFTTMGASGIADITAAGINIYTEGRTIIVENAAEAITVSDALGRVVGKDDAQIVRTEIRKFPVPSSGVYVVKIGNRAASVLVR